MTKTIHCQAKNNEGGLVFDLQLEGKTHKLGLIRQATAEIQNTGGVIRYQETGAGSWAKYRVMIGQDFAVQDQEIDWND